jgi:hypothetical protein
MLAERAGSESAIVCPSRLVVVTGADWFPRVADQAEPMCRASSGARHRQTASADCERPAKVGYDEVKGQVPGGE